MNEHLLTSEELAKQLGLPKYTIERMMRRKMIPCLKFGHRSVRYEKQKVIEALARFEVREVTIPSTRKDLRYGSVYVIKSGDKYKIGVAENVEKRLLALQTASPNQLTLIYKHECSMPYQFERYWHNRFRGARVMLEWFALDEAQLSEISDPRKWPNL